MLFTWRYLKFSDLLLTKLHCIIARVQFYKRLRLIQSADFDNFDKDTITRTEKLSNDVIWYIRCELQSAERAECLTNTETHVLEKGGKKLDDEDSLKECVKT